jgi:hypothetical protein
MAWRSRSSRYGRLALVVPALGSIAAAAGITTATAGAIPVRTNAARPAAESGLPAKRIEAIEQADGTVSGGVLAIDLDRADLKVHRRGVLLKPGFEIQDELYFQALPTSDVMFNGDLAVTTGRTQAVIDAIEANHLVFQAEHQHFTDARSVVWFIHFRGTGSATSLASRVHRVVQASGVALPQSSPAQPSTPLPAHKLASILGGEAQVGENGIVTVDIDRANTERLGGHPIKPGLGVSTGVEFQPTGHGGALVIPDFGMTANEIGPVTRAMRAHGWYDECLYNQETAESPQLYYSHMAKQGNAVALAHEVRAGLNHMNVGH